MKAILSTIILLASFLLSSCDVSKEVHSLDSIGNGLCIPDKYISKGGVFFFMSQNTDESSHSVLIDLPSSEVVAQIPDWKTDSVDFGDGKRKFTDLLVRVTDRKLITGLSANQQRLIDKIISNNASFIKTENTKYLVVKNEQMPFEAFYLVKEKISQNVAQSTDPLLWIKASCSKISEFEKNRIDCSVDRIYKKIAYEYNIVYLNIGNLDNVDTLIQGYLDKWENACKK